MTNAPPLRLAALTGAALLFTAAPAAAQDSGATRGGWAVTIGGGGQTYPQYPGANSNAIAFMPIVGLRREGNPMPFSAQDDGAGFGLLGHDSIINFGPAINFQNARQDSDVGAPVGKVPFTVEAGGFVEIYPIHAFRIHAELRRGVGGHDALVGHVSADLVLRDGDKFIFSIGPRARWGSRDYEEAYFGVTPAVAVATGLAPYQPHSGFYAAGVESTLTYRLGRNWGMRGYVGYDRMVNDAADSPIVRTYGSRDQFSGGAGLFLEFNVFGHRS